MDGESVETFDSLREMLSYYKVGEEVEVVYCRLNDKGEYDENTVTVTLTAKSWLNTFGFFYTGIAMDFIWFVAIFDFMGILKDFILIEI